MKKILILLLSMSMVPATETGGGEKKALLADQEDHDDDSVDAPCIKKCMLISRDLGFNRYVIGWFSIDFNQGHSECSLESLVRKNPKESREDIIGKDLGRMGLGKIKIPAGPKMDKIMYLMLELKEEKSMRELKEELPVSSMEIMDNQDGQCDAIFQSWRDERERKIAFANQMREASCWSFLIKSEPGMEEPQFTQK